MILHGGTSWTAWATGSLPEQKTTWISMSWRTLMYQEKRTKPCYRIATSGWTAPKHKKSTPNASHGKALGWGKQEGAGIYYQQPLLDRTTVARIYKERWHIEAFFKLIKQNLKIKSFVGTSENAVQIQIWTALLTILLMTFLKTKAKYPWHMSNLVTFIRLNLFVKIDLWEWVNQPFVRPKKEDAKQLLLFTG